MDKKCANSTETTEEHEVDTLSLCDLPHIHHSQIVPQKDNITPPKPVESQQEDFHFCPLPTPPQMRAADEIFHRGQILPLPQLPPKNASPQHHDKRDFTRSKPPPSPKPRFSSNRPKKVKSSNKLSVWNVFRSGLVSPPPDIAFRDVKKRSIGNYNSTNCVKRNSRQGSGEKKIETKKRRGLIGGCRYCSGDAVDAVRVKVVVSKISLKQVEEETNLLAKKSDCRTFEWLNQLTIEGDND